MKSIDVAAEERFERGFPHLRELLDDHPHDTAPAAWALKAVAGRREYRTAWPREVATRFLRALKAANPTAAAQQPGPFTEAEARALLTALTNPADKTREHLVESALFLVEALRGTGWTLDAVLRCFEAMTPAARGRPNLHGPRYVAWWSGFLLLRAPAAVASRARKRMRTLVAQGLDGVTQQLAFILDGERALVASGHKITPFNLLFCSDPAFMAKHARYPGFVVLDPYLAWLGGDAVLEVYVELAKKVDREWAPLAIDGLALLSSPLAVKVLEVLSEKKYLAGQVAAALARRH